MSERKHPANQQHPYGTPKTFPDSGPENVQAAFRDSGELDMAVAYMLGEASYEERFGFENALATGDEQANYSYNNATRTIDELSGSLIPENPPPFAKDRIMARVRTDSVNYFMPPQEG